MINKELLLSTAYLPSIDYVIALSGYKHAIIEQFETFPKQTFRNRCLIYSANGALPLSIPVEKPAGNNTKTSEVLVAYGYDNWMHKHWRAIESAYNSSPFFLYYKDGLQRIFEEKYERLIDFNTQLLRFVLDKLRLKIEVGFSSDFLPVGSKEVCDLRYAFSPKQQNAGINFSPYYQVFNDKHGFIPNLSIIDLLFNTGPEARVYIDKYLSLCKNSQQPA